MTDAQQTAVDVLTELAQDAKDEGVRLRAAEVLLIQNPEAV